SYHQAVGSLLWIRAFNTLVLSSVAITLAWAIALPWGVLQAMHAEGWRGNAGLLFTASFLAIPDAALALLLLLFALWTGWLPTGGMSSPNASQMTFTLRVADLCKHLFLPSVALAFGSAPILAGHVRSAMIGVLDSTFIAAARGHGIPEW